MSSEPEINNDGTAERQSAGWDIRNAPKNYISLVIAHGATALLSFASVWLITRNLGSEGYGAIIALVAASQLVQVFINWSSTALARFGIEEFVETGKITRSFWTRTLIFFPNLTFILIAGAFWLTPLAAVLKIPDAVIWMIAVHILTTSIWLHVQYSMQAAKMLRLQGALLAVERALTCGGILLFIWLGSVTLENLLWCYIMPPVILSGAGFILLRSFIEFSGFYDAVQFRKMLKFSLPLIPFAIVGYLSTSQLDAFFITRYFSTSDLGIYAVAAQINGIVLQLPILANTLLLSLFVSLKAAGRESLLHRFFKDAVPSITLAWSGFCVTLGAAGFYFIPLVFGKEFESAANILWILTTSSVLAFPVLMGFATVSNAYSKTYISMYASIATALANVAFNFILIPRFGMLGCAWATVLSGLTNLTVFYVLLRKSGLISPNWVFLSIQPAVLGAFILSIWGSEWAALAVFGFLLFFVAYLHLDSVYYAIGVLKGKLNVKDVPSESSLR